MRRSKIPSLARRASDHNRAIQSRNRMAGQVRIGIIGAGLVSDFHHVPGIRLDPRAELVSVCDPNEQLLAQRKAEWGPATYTTRYEDVAADPNVDAVIIATPNFTHKP